ncbi:hypothetical protein [uncultured Flavobacterium sp.]|uniref:hypothetical protein n=1 Tax=uncultured Flavobacterium sp. TaxID=165435 RepID=UPI002591AF52|nr:hypothetical protein [uncultured Flavobacterium sp.]
MYDEMINVSIQTADVIANLNSLAHEDGVGPGIQIAREALRVELNTQVLVLDRLVHMMPEEKAQRWAMVRVCLFAVMFK